MSVICGGYVLPGVPHILLAHDRNPGWAKVREAMEKVRNEVEQSEADVLILYSSYWPSVIGHQIQADPLAEWVHVDDEFHELGSIPYQFSFDEHLAQACVEVARKRGLHARTVAYRGFPIDTGSVVVLKLINPSNRIPAIIVSSNIYADRAETLVLGKAVRSALEETGRKALVIGITSLSNRLHETWIHPKDDKIHSLKDQEWNAKFLELLGEGRLEDVSQLSRQFHKEARVPKVSNFKTFWFMAATMGQSNLYSGEVYEHQPVYGSGALVAKLVPSSTAARDLEFDEEDPEVYLGDRNVLAPPEEMMRDPFQPRDEDGGGRAEEI